MYLDLDRTVEERREMGKTPNPQQTQNRNRNPNPNTREENEERREETAGQQVNRTALGQQRRTEKERGPVL